MTAHYSGEQPITIALTYEEVNMAKHSLNKDDNDMVKPQLLSIVDIW